MFLLHSDKLCCLSQSLMLCTRLKPGQGSAKPFFFHGLQMWADLRLLSINGPSVSDSILFFSIAFMKIALSCVKPPFGFGSSWEMTLNDLFCLFLMELTLHHLLIVQIDSRNLSLSASQRQRGCAVLISYLAGCMGHKAFALHYCCWQSRAKKMDDLFVVLPSSFLSHTAPFSSLLPPL